MTGRTTMLCVLLAAMSGPPAMVDASSHASGAQSGPSSQPTATASQLADEGVRLTSLDQTDEARALFERARDLATAQGDATVEGRAEWGLGRLAYLRRDHETAEAHYRRAARRLEDGQATDLLAVLALQRGGELIDLGDRAGAARRWRDGIEAAKVKGPRWIHAQLLRSLTFLPDVAVAERLLMIEDAERLLAGENRVALEGLVAHQHGDLAFVAGDYTRALRETERAVSLLERAAAPRDLARALTSVGRIYRVHGQPEQAIPYFRRALEVQLGLANTTALVQSLIGIATAELSLMRYDEATTAYAQAVEAARTSPDASDLPLALIQQAYGFVEMGRVSDADRAIAAAAALPHDARHDASLLGVQGMVHVAAGRHAEGVLAFDRALVATGLTEDVRVEMLERRAHALDALGRSAEAIAAAQDGLAALERLRATLVPRDFFKRRFDEKWSRLFALSVRRLAGAGEARRSLEVAERARARAFADLLASRVVQQTPLLSSAAAAIAPAEVLVLRGPGATGMGRGVGLDSAARVESASIDEMTAVARALQTTIVSYWVDRDVAFAWVIAPSGDVRVAQLAIGARALQRAVQATFASPAPRPRAPSAAPSSRERALARRGGPAFTLGPEARTAYRTLHDAIVAPIRQWLPVSGDLVTVVPHGPLFRLSFAALTNRSGRYLVEDYRLAYAPSLAVLRLVHERPERTDGPSYLLVGDPRLPAPMARDERLERLPGAAREVEAIRRRVAPAETTVLRDAQASERAVRDAAPGARVLHLATHAIVDDARPFESYLALAGDPAREDGDARLTAEEVYDLRLDADLVVLSACRSAGGPVTGDGLLGLTRAFVSAGARSVIATLWDLPDEVATVLVPRFYREWLATGSKANALRRAQLTYIAELRAGKVVVSSPLGKTTLQEHPSLWASLVLLGHP